MCENHSSVFQTEHLSAQYCMFLFKNEFCAVNNDNINIFIYLGPLKTVTKA